MEINLKRKYLTIEEICEIIEEMKLENGSYNRELTKVNLVIKTLFDYDFGEMLNTEVYNFAVENNLIEKLEDEVSNYFIIDKMIKEELSVENTVREFLENLDKKLDKVMKKLPEKVNLKDLSELVQKALSKNVNI